MDCSLPGFPVHGDSPGNILEWFAMPPPGDLPNPEIEPRSSALQADSVSEPPGKSIYVCVCVCVCVCVYTHTLYYSASLRAWFQQCVDTIKWAVDGDTLAFN